MQKWMVLWKNEEGKRKRKMFDGPKPSEAIKYAKGLKRDGVNVDVASAGHAFPPSEKQELKRRPGMLWCPYCIKFRNFRLLRLKTQYGTSGADLRCPICLISTNHYYVKRYNGLDYMTEADIIKRYLDLREVI